MTPDILAELEKEIPSAEMLGMLRRCRDLVKLSRNEMSKRYEEWDRHDFVYQGYKVADAEDKKSEEKKQPIKMTVPITHSQVQTFVAFAFSVLFQRENFFDLTPYSVESTRAEKVGEALLQRDLDYNNFYQKTYQFLLDTARFGLGVFKNAWFEEVQWARETTQPKQVDFLGVKFSYGGGKQKRVRKVVYQGNKINSVSPYRWFPDPRFPISQFQDGEFVASEDEYAYTALKGLENEGIVAGIDYVHTLQKDPADAASAGRRLNKVEYDTNRRRINEVGAAALVTEIQITVVPAKVMIAPDKPLGEEDYPVKYLIWFLNDERIIRFEELDYPSNRYTYTAAEFSPDITHFLNDGLAGTIDVLQDVISWFVNSHITSVRKIIQNRLVVDPEAVEMDDIKNQRTGIRLKKGMNRQGIDAYLKQLDVHDATAGHMEDANTLNGLIQVVTGINDNALGQFNTGRRSATEARNVNAGVAARLKMIVMLIYYGGFEPLGRQMLSNLRHGLTVGTYIKIFGLVQDPNLEQFFEFAKVTSKDLIGEYDFEILDGTLPSEKSYIAQTLQELIAMLLQTPELAVMLGYDVRALISEMLRMRGVRHPEQYQMSEAQRSSLMTQMAVMQMAQNAGQPQNNGNRQNDNGAPQRGGVGQAATTA